MNEYKREDQADGLRSRMIDEYKMEHGDYPPRSDIHKDKTKKTKLKMKYPVISLLALFFILLPIFILSMNLYFGNEQEQDGEQVNIVGEDTVFISSGQDEEIETETTQEENSPEQQIEDDQTTDKEVSVALDKTSTPSDQNLTTITEENTSNVEKTEPEQDEVTNEGYKEIKTHKVAAGETLFKIAIKYYNSREGEEIIRKYNGLNGNNVYVGQVLKIPIK